MCYVAVLSLSKVPKNDPTRCTTLGCANVKSFICDKSLIIMVWPVIGCKQTYTHTSFSRSACYIRLIKFCFRFKKYIVTSWSLPDQLSTVRHLILLPSQIFNFSPFLLIMFYCVVRILIFYSFPSCDIWVDNSFVFRKILHYLFLIFRLRMPPKANGRMPPKANGNESRYFFFRNISVNVCFIYKVSHETWQ